MAVKKISEFPVVEAIGVKVFGRVGNKNVQTILDIKQSIGIIGSESPPSTTSIVSEEALSKAIGALTTSINNKSGVNTIIGVNINSNKDIDNPIIIAEPSDSIGVALQKAVDYLISDSIGATIGITSPKKTLSIGVNTNTNTTTIDVNIDNEDGNRLYLTPTGALRVDSENFWQKME